MENTILFSLMTKTMENTMCSSSDDVDDEDYMENTMCSSSDDVNDEDYGKHRCVLPLEKCLFQYVSNNKLL